jgi:TonB family protein
MKNNFFQPMKCLTLLMLLSFAVLNAQAQNNTLVGTWKHTKLKMSNHEFQDIPDNIQKLKFITPGHYTMILITTNDKTPKMAFGGDYKLDGENYQETSTFNSGGPTHVGEVFKATLTFNNADEVLITYGEGENKTAEIWQRVKESLTMAANSQTAPEKLPEYPGGIAAFLQYIQANLKYPPQAVKDKIQGKVIISFIVDIDGTLTDVKVVQGIGGGCDEEAVRLFENSPKWQPGYQNNKAVKVAFTMPINFSAGKESR